MTTLKSSNESENKTATSHVVDDLRFGMEDNVGNSFLSEMYNMSKTSDESFQPMPRISSEKKTINFDRNISNFRNLKSKNSSVYLNEFETMRADVKKNMTGNDRNRMFLLQDKIVSSSVENVQIIERFDSREGVSLSKEKDSASGKRVHRKQSKNFSIQKGGKSSFKKKDNSSLPLLASKAEIKTLPSSQTNFQLGTTGTLVGEIPSAKRSSVDNISQSASSKKRKYKVKVKVRRKKQKRKSSPPPPPPPPKLSPHLTKLPAPPPPPLPRLPSQMQLQAGFPALPSYPRSLLPPPMIALPIPALSLPPGPSIPDYPHGNSNSGNATTLPTYPEMLTTIPYYQLHQVVQTPQCTVGGPSYLQATGPNFPCAIHNSYPSFFNVPHALPFYSNYPTLNTQMHICHQSPVLPYIHPQPSYSNYKAENFKY